MKIQDLAMLGFIFGFNARLGRLPFFFLCILLAIVMTLICFAIAWHGFQRFPRSGDLAIEAVAIPVLLAMLFFLFATFQLQSMRIRDIGWDPVLVLSGWLFLIAVDKIVTLKMPGLAIGPGHGTGLGAVVNLVFVVVLTFWPSGEPDDSLHDRKAFAPRLPDRPPPSAIRAAVMRAPNAAGFGRRGP